MPNILRPTAENADELLNAGAYGAGALIRIQSSAIETGTFANLSGTGSTTTIALVAGTRAYTGYDPNGGVSTWYRTRFESSDGLRTSDWSTAFQLGSDGAGLICSLYDARQRLESNGGTLSNTEIEQVTEYIQQVTSFIQGYTGRRFVRDPASGTEVLTFDVARDSRTLWVPKGIAACTQVEVATYTGGTFTVVPTADWYLDPPEQSRDYGWPATRVTISDRPTGSISQFYQGKRTARLTMALGWDTIPFDIQGIGLTLVTGAYKERASAGGDSFTIDIDGSRRFERSLSYRDRMMLDFYRVPRSA